MSSKKLSIRKYESKRSLISELTSSIEIILRDSIKKRQQALMIVSGGSTPKTLFEDLSEIDLPWEKVTILLADERWLPTNHSASNEKLVNDFLLKNRAIKANFIGLKTEHGSTFEGLPYCEKKLKGVINPDLLILGMGLDGHTASYFSVDTDLKDKLSMDSKLKCSRVNLENENFERVTLNFNYLSRARKIFLHIHGLEKLQVLKESIINNDPIETPIAVFFDQDLKVFWSE